jgi:hypothetical protein
MPMTNSVRLSSVVLGMLLLASTARGDQPAVGRSCGHAAQARQHKAMRMVTWPLAPALSRVSCSDRMLAIYADNARLTEILDRVAKCTGATVDAPAEADDIISTRLGPAPSLQVLVALLDRTRFDFFITSATGDASEICVVKLMPRSSAPAPAAPVAAPQTASAADRAAQIANLTGGDEGVWDNVEVGTPVTPSASSVAGAVRSPLPVQPKASPRKDPQ